jgi:Zn-dependent protease
MLDWSIKLFRIRGIQLAIHASLPLWCALLVWLAWEPDEGWMGAARTVALLVTLYSCVVLHELGHSFAAMALGIGVQRILVLPIGGMAIMDEMPRRPLHEWVITVAGPAVNFAIAGAILGVINVVNFPDDGLAGEVAQLLPAIALWNVLMGFFNLIPAFPMDGGRLLRASLAVVMPRVEATFCAALIGKVVAVGAVLMVWALAWLGPLSTLSASVYTVLFGFIMFVGEVEYRVEQDRERDDAHWRMVLARQAALLEEARASGVLLPVQ